MGTRIDLDQRSEDWYSWREGGIGASDAATLLGLNPYKTPHQYWLERTGKKEKEKQNEAMLHGIRFEDDARAHYISKSGRGVAPACYQHDVYTFMRASLDGITLDGSHVVDFKCPRAHTWDTILRSGNAPLYWSMQLQYQILCCKATTGELSIFNPYENESIEIPVHADADLQDELIEAASYMWKCIREDKAPTLTDLDMEFKEFRHDEEYYQLCQEEAKIKARKEELRKAMIDASNGSDYRTRLLTVKQTTKSQVDWKKYAEELDPDGVHKDDFVKQLDIWTIRQIKRSR